MDYYSPKHVDHLIENKVYSQELCASCWFIYILRLTLFFQLHMSVKWPVSKGFSKQSILAFPAYNMPSNIFGALIECWLLNCGFEVLSYSPSVLKNNSAIRTTCIKVQGIISDGCTRKISVIGVCEVATVCAVAQTRQPYKKVRSPSAFGTVTFANVMHEQAQKQQRKR